MPINNFQRIIGFDPASLAVRSYYRDQRLRRVTEIQKLWDMYRGDHWSYAPNVANRTTAISDKTTVNLIMPFVNKLVSFLLGKGVNFIVPEGKEDTVLKYLNAVWKDNNKDALLQEMGQIGTVTGDVYLYMTLSSDKKRLIMRPLDERYVTPLWDDDDRTRLKEAVIIEPILERNATESELAPVLGDGDVNIRVRKIHITKTTFSVYVDDELQEGYPMNNALGEVPVIHIPNMIEAIESRGMSSVKPLIPLQHRYNDKFSDVDEIIAYHAAPITIVQGARVNQLEKGAKKVWGGLPKDGKVYNLELTSDLAAALSFLALIKQHMHEIAQIPEGTLGKERKISNTSGVAIGLEYQPLTDINNMRKATYGAGFQRVCRLMLRYAEVYSAVAKFYGCENIKAALGDDERTKYEVEAQFPDPLPKDELAQLQVIIQRITNKLMSRFEALRTLGETNPEAELQKIAEELLKEAELQTKIMVDRAGKLAENAAPQIEGPNPGSKKQPINPAVVQHPQTPAGAVKTALNGRNGEEPSKTEGRTNG